MTYDMSEQVLDRRMTPPPRALLGLRGQLWDNPNIVRGDIQLESYKVHNSETS